MQRNICQWTDRVSIVWLQIIGLLYLITIVLVYFKVPYGKDVPIIDRILFSIGWLPFTMWLFFVAYFDRHGWGDSVEVWEILIKMGTYKKDKSEEGYQNFVSLLNNLSEDEGKKLREFFIGMSQQLIKKDSQISSNSK